MGASSDCFAHEGWSSFSQLKMPAAKFSQREDGCLPVGEPTRREVHSFGSAAIHKKTLRLGNRGTKRPTSFIQAIFLRFLRGKRRSHLEAPDTQVGGQQSATLWRHTLNSTYPQGGSAWNATPPTNFDERNDNLVLAQPTVTEILFSPGRQDGLDGSRAANSLDPNLIKLRGS